MSILGEMRVKSGSIELKGQLAYVPQEPWILSGTVQENVIFGGQLDTEKYKKAITACALDKVWYFSIYRTKFNLLMITFICRVRTGDFYDLLQDIKRMESGDQSLVGERGHFMSGGQKARINLAR